jgi:SHS2 domain-containing protein
METAGFIEIEHTADWELKVWGTELSDIFEQAALGLFSLTGMVLKSKPRLSRMIEMQNVDSESLLVDFLSELLYFSEAEEIGFDSFDIRIHGSILKATLYGAPVDTMTREIKAVTYHNLAINQGVLGLEVSIVFDV